MQSGHKIFGFPDNGQGKGHQTLQVQTESKPDRKKIHIFGVILTIFDKKLMFKGKIVNFKPIIVVLDPFLKLRYY